MYWIQHDEYRWFKDYLANRVQVTKVGRAISAPRLMTCGVPQGSILGPLLSLIYVNDLSKYLSECDVNLYADDTAVYNHSESYIELLLSLKIEIDNIDQWMRANRLTLNIKKTKGMIIVSRDEIKQLPATVLKLHDEPIEFVTEFKYLGVILDNQLNFEAYICNLYRKACSKVGAIKKTGNV